MKWIPTTQQLPDTSRFVWITVEGAGYRSTKEGYYDSRKELWFEYSNNVSLGYIPLALEESVTAWLEIPRCPPPYYETIGDVNEKLIPKNQESVASVA